MKEHLLLEGLVKILRGGINARLENDEKAKDWIKDLNRTVEFQLRGIGTISVKIKSGRVSVKAGSYTDADYILEADYDDIVDYVNGELGYSELLLKFALRNMDVKKMPLMIPSEFLNVLRIDEVFVLSRKKERFPRSLLDDARRVLLDIAKHLPEPDCALKYRIPRLL